MADTEPRGAIQVDSVSSIPQFEQSEQNDEVQMESHYGRCHKFKYKARKFSSKAALMVLIWNMLINTMFGSLSNLYLLFHLSDMANLPIEVITDILPMTALVLSALLSGWLADTYLGHYRMAKIGLILIFTSAVLLCLLVVAMEISEVELSMILRAFLYSVTASLTTGSAAVLLVNLPQVGLDQMPDCTTESITSFITWYIASFFTGFWIGDIASTVGFACVGKDFVIVFNLFPIVLLAFVLISDIFLTSKWLILAPKSHQSLKTVYRVLKFAKQHKAPVNRSALTYWEEEIPPRIDLGKSRYGGPFTTEQVEDVKTLFRILVITIPLWISLLSFFMYSNSISLLDSDPTILSNGTVQNCTTEVLKCFTYNWFLLAIILTIVFELTVYPLIGHKLPSSIQRIGASTLFIVITNTLCFFLIIYYYYINPFVPTVLAYIHSLGVAVIFVAFLTSSVEFVCAQTPYHMRGLLLGYLWCMTFCMLALAGFVFYVIKDNTTPFAVLVHSIAATLLSFAGFVLFLCSCSLVQEKSERRHIQPSPVGRGLL